MNLFWFKVNVKHFGFNNLDLDFDIMRIVHTVMDLCWDKKHLLLWEQFSWYESSDQGY